jgi:ATP-dependent DNA helicase RecG
MRSLADIQRLLAELDHQQAEALEDQDLDFKEWPCSSLNDAVAFVSRACRFWASGSG